MSATRDVAGLGRGRLVAVLLLVAALGAGLAACRGLFGQAPIALLVADAGGDGEVPVTITFDISGSNDPDGVIAAYELDFGDGSTEETGTDVTVPVVHEYEESGTFTVLLTVTDNDGRIGMANAVVTVGPVMIAFASDRVGDYDIYRMEADGTNLVSVHATADEQLFPDLVRGTRDKIAYAGEDGAVWNIWTMTVAGANATKLTTQTASKQIQPSWSYDASKIAYASNADATPSATTWEIWSMTAAGGTQTRLTTTQAPSWSLAPAYSPLNNDIVFVSGSLANGTTAATGGSALLKRSAAGVITVVYDGPGNDGDASRLPTGLAASLDLPTNVGISKPAWSPDGTKIAFSTERTDGGIIDIYVINASALNGSPAPVSLETYVTGLASYTGSITAGTITSGEDEFSPYWLEDGSGMAFVKEVAGAYHVYKVSFTTGLITKLTDAGANVSPASNR
jgi:PKD repeat protein